MLFLPPILILYVNSSQLFANTDPQSIVALVKCLESTMVMPQELILRQGEASDAMHFIVTGIVDIYEERAKKRISPVVQQQRRVTSSQKNERSGFVQWEVLWVGERTSGEYFGEVGMLNKSVRESSVEARTFCELETLAARDCVHLYATFPDIFDAMGEQVGNNLRMQKAMEKANSQRALRYCVANSLTRTMFC
jgi:CRP-like cAMP-binding protein